MAEKKKRPKTLTGETIKIATGCGSMYVTLNGDATGVFEVFAALGKAGTCAKVQVEAITRMITLALKYDVPMQEIIDELQNLRCPSPVWADKKQILSCPDAIAKVLSENVSSDERQSD